MKQMTLLERAFYKLVEPICSRWCPVCGVGRPLIPGAIQIECWFCGVTVHCDNWNVEPPKDK